MNRPLPPWLAKHKARQQGDELAQEGTRRLSITCTVCAGRTYVTDSRPRRGNTIYRRRICETCGARFTTHEMLADTNDYSRGVLEGLRMAAAAIADSQPSTRQSQRPQTESSTPRSARRSDPQRP